MWTMSFELGLTRWPPCDLPGCAASTHRSLSFARWFSICQPRRAVVGSVGRAIGLDVHRDFCEVAIVEGGALRSAGRIATTPERLELFA